MAAISAIKRTIIIPNDNALYDEAAIKSAVVTLVASTANLVVLAMKMNYIQFQQFISGQFVFRRGLELELIETVAGDIVIAANLTAFQTALGVTISTWTETISYGW